LSKTKLLLLKNKLLRLHGDLQKLERLLEKSKLVLIYKKSNLKLQSSLLKQVPLQPRRQWMKELPEKRDHSRRPEQEEKELLQQLLPLLKNKLRLNFKLEEKRMLLKFPNIRR